MPPAIAPEASLSALAENLGVSRPTASVLVDRLVQRGLVARGTDPAERRRAPPAPGLPYPCCLPSSPYWAPATGSTTWPCRRPCTASSRGGKQAPPRACT